MLKSKVKTATRVHKLLKSFQDVERICVQLGFFSGATHPRGGSIPLIAMQNEYGFISSTGARVPPRPFLHPLLHNPQVTARWRSKFTAALKQAIRHRQTIDSQTVHTTWEILGEEMVNDLQNAIIDLDTPPNAPSTIKKKGSSNPLVDLGKLKESATFKITTT